MARLNTVVYTMTDCPFCAKAKEILRDMKIEFEERNVTEHPRFAKELRDRTRDNKLPTVIINKSVLVKPGEDKLRATVNYELHR